MSNKIRQLDETSIRQIAAGEVVERPASVVKELLENALDAGATRIALDVEQGGRKLIRVSDNGCGMTPADAALSLERHTTSKIKDAGDLETLSSFGFRGEALPSIASVSRLELITREAHASSGTVIAVAGSKTLSQNECGRAIGTTVEIRDLFFNTPARLKFMKTESTEKSKILKTFEETALAHPQIAFETRFDGKKTGEFPARENGLERLGDLWGGAFNGETLVPLSCEHPRIGLTGWISTPGAHQPTKAYQIFYVNRRPIVSRVLTHALYEAYRDCLPVGRHPAAVLFIRLDPSEVDVNVHPAKREVRFRNEHQIYETVIREIRLKRSQLSSAPKVLASGGSFGGLADAPSAEPRENRQAFIESRISRPDTMVSRDTFMSEIRNRPSLVVPQTGFQTRTGEQEMFLPAPKIIAQFSSLYILAEQGDSLLLIDQHAAGERILYEKFRAALLSQASIPTQPLLFPLQWDVTLSQAEQIKECLATLHKIGFLVEPFGEKTFRVTEAPAVVPAGEVKSVLDEILNGLEDPRQPTLAVEEKIMHAACRAAIKANDSLTLKEMIGLVDDLQKCSNPHTCPHGRPITLTLTRQELDKKFGRT